MPVAAPFLRWAGGKSRLLPALRAALPLTFDSYHEPFLGGGALMFDLQARPGTVINDATTDLAAAYVALRDTPREFVAALGEHGKDTSKEAYLALRAANPDQPLARGARFVALNRMSFNGMWRVNRAGQMNVPYGQLANPTICNTELLLAVSAHLQGTRILSGDYLVALQHVRPGDLVYLDPPYLPASATSSFASYHQGGFGLAEHRQLAAVCADLAARGVHVMASNADTEVAREIFAGLNLHAVTVRRSISANPTGRGQVGEIIATSYPPSVMRNPQALAALSPQPGPD